MGSASNTERLRETEKGLMESPCAEKFPRATTQNTEN